MELLFALGWEVGDHIPAETGQRLYRGLCIGEDLLGVHTVPEKVYLDCGIRAPATAHTDPPRTAAWTVV